MRNERAKALSGIFQAMVEGKKSLEEYISQLVLLRKHIRTLQRLSDTPNTKTTPAEKINMIRTGRRILKDGQGLLDRIFLIAEEDITSVLSEFEFHELPLGEILDFFDNYDHDKNMARRFLGNLENAETLIWEEYGEWVCNWVDRINDREFSKQFLSNIGIVCALVDNALEQRLITMLRTLNDKDLIEKIFSDNDVCDAFDDAGYNPNSIKTNLLGTSAAPPASKPAAEPTSS